MTNEEATKILNVFIELLGSSGGRTLFWDWYTAKDKYLEALNTAIEALKAQPCEDCVSRQVVLEIVEREQFKGDAISEIEKLPPVTPKPKAGKWISDLQSYGYGKGDYHCSICGRGIHLCRPQEQLTDYPYCHCGAKMEGESK